MAKMMLRKRRLARDWERKKNVFPFQVEALCFKGKKLRSFTTTQKQAVQCKELRKEFLCILKEVFKNKTVVLTKKVDLLYKQ